ncbi:MAG TPA: DegV family protein [Acidimicrobiia bacterium]|nr:DegV family protein [Acidimicrobiia bacterium]
MAVAIVTDSAAALPAELALAHDITIVPMWLTVGGVASHDGEVPLGEMLAHDDVTTSGPTPGEFEAAVKERQRETDDGVLLLTIASTMSSTHEAAVVGARAAGGPVRVVDTATAAGAQALVVLAAAAAAEHGMSLEDVERAASVATAQVRLLATVPNLDHLVRSGRVPNIAGWAGRRLGIAPLFEFRDGGARPLRPALGMPAALDRIVSRWRRDRVPGARLHVAALHAQAEASANELLTRVRAEVDPATAFVGPFGSVMVVHTGPGLVGLAWRWEPAS